MLLVRRAFVSVARRNRDADPDIPRQIEEGRNVLGRMAVEDRRIDVDRESLRLGGSDGGDRNIKDAFLRYGFVVVILQTVKMNRKKEIGRRLEQMKLLFEQQSVGA